MDNSPQDDESPHDYDEIPSRDPPPGTDLNTNPQTIREYQTRLQDLNRENFDLKLRIFFLEQNGSNTKTNLSIQNQSSPRFPSTYGFYDEQDPFQTRQTGYERDLRHSSLSPIRRQPDSSNDDELSPSVRNRYGRDRPENDKTHRSYRHSGESGEYTPTINIDPITQTFVTTSTPIDSNQGTLMPTSTYNLQLNDRERRVQDENNALKKENTALRSRVNENFDELKRVKGQYETAVRDNEEQQVKAERVIKRMKADYEARLADVEEEKRQKLSQYESYRHEQEQTNSNVNIEEYLRKIDEQERLIKQLNDRLDAGNAFQEKPYTAIHPSSPNDENSRRLNEYAETIDQLRGECDELRRSEKHLRRQVDELNRLFEPTNGHLPPTSRPSIVDDAEPVDDPQSAIAHTSIKLQKDAENVSGVTNRIHQMIREREDNQNKLKEKDAQIRQYEAREREFESRILQKFESQIEGLQHEIKHLEQETRDRDRRIAELEDDIKSQVTHHDPDMESRHSREKQDYEQRIHVANGHIDGLRQEIDREHQEYDSLRKDYEKMKDTLDSSNIESLEETIQQQGKQIEEDHAQLQALEKTFQQQRAYLEREKDYEKQKAEQNQNELDNYKKRYADLQSQYEQLRPLLDDQQNKYEKQIRSYQAELAQVEQERDDLNDELQLLKHEKETLTTRGPENHPKFLELQEQVARYAVSVHDSEDDNNRYRRELSTLQGDYQTTNQHYEDLKDAHTKAQDDNQALNQENTKLKHDIEDLEVRIRFEIQQEQENENRLNKQKDAEIENAQREKEAVEFELERVNNERKQFENQLRDVEDELQKANETIDNYVQDLDRLRQDLNKAKENNEQIERDISQAYADKLRDQNDRIQELEQQLKSNGNRPNSVYYDEQISPSHEAPTNYYEQTSFDENDRVVRRSNIPDQRALVSQLENKLRERDDVIQSLRNSRATGEGEPTDIELKFQIQIQQLEKDLEGKDRVIEKYTETAQAQEQYIEKLLDNLQQGDSSPTGVVQTLREELDNRNRRIDQILNDRNLEIDQRDRQIGVLELNIKDRDHKLAETVERLGEAEQKIDEQQLEIDDLIREKQRLTIVPEDRETYLTQIQNLEKALEMEKRMSTATPSEQRDHYQSVIDDLKRQIHRRDDSIQRYKRYVNSDDNLQRTLRDSDEQLKDTRQAQHKMANDFNRTNVHADQLVSDVENRDQAIASLREKLAEKDQEINKLHENNLTKEQKLNDLYSKLIQIDPNIKPTGLSSERAPSNVQMKIDLQRKEQEINDLKQRLEQALADPSSSSTATIPQEPKYRQRPSYDHLNREELLYELEMALQHNQELNEQLQAKNPTTGVKEIHRRLNEVRDELARQKYVNQVLWRKLDALIDIHGSNTRNELAIELANYQDELAKLKSKQNRTNETRSAILNAPSRSSSEQNISTLYSGLSSTGHEFPSKNIKSTIALLERSNIEWQTKLARLTEQLGRSESQSRNYHRELIKYQKLLNDAGLMESNTRQRRRSADDSVIIGLNDSNVIDDDLTKIDNLDELKEIIGNQRKYNQQLQMRIRLNTPDVIQSPVIEKLNEQIQNLNLVIETYKNESHLLKTELKKLYKTVEHYRKTSQQYEQLLKDQQLSIEQSTQKLTRYDQLLKKYDIHLPIFDETKEHFIDEYIIDLDIDLIQGNDKKKNTSLGRKDSGISSVATDPAEQQRQIRDKDDQIRNLNNQLREKDEQIQQIINDLKNSKKAYEDLQQQNRNDYDRIRRDLTDELRATQNELQEARLQLDSLKTSRPKYEQVEDQNQRLRTEIKQLQNEIETSKPLLDHYKKQIDILEKRTPSVHDADSSDMIIRSSELSQLLEEMRLLRRDLERSLQKQNELQAKLDENIRQSQSPREFTFTGRGVSYPDLRVTDGLGFLGPETLSLSSNLNGKYSKPLASSSTDLDHIEFPSLSTRETERTVTIKTYIVGELRIHNELRQLIENIKFDLKSIAQEWKEKLRSRTNSSITDAFIRSLDERFIALDERLTHALDLIETYWKADLPEKNRDDEHVFIDQRLFDENKHLLAAQRKYIRDTQILREKYTEQSKHLDQLLAQLTKANRKKADTGDYLALLLRPTLDVLQKARSNIENHLKETNPNNIPPGSAQSRRRHRSNRQE